MSYKNRSFILSKHPEIAEALDEIMRNFSQVMDHTNTTARGGAAPPPPVSAISVDAKEGIFDVSITDNSSSVSRGINYFLEYSTSPQFEAPTVVDLGASRNWRRMLGNHTLYFRAYSAYPTSPRSDPLHFSRPVMGGGKIVGPPISISSGSGTSAGPSASDGGFGNQQTRVGRK